MASKSLVRPVLFIIFLFIYSCKPSAPVLPDAELLSTVLRSYTKGIISSQSTLKYIFVDDIVADEEVGKPLKAGVISLKPSISGEAYWESKNTLAFKPSQKLKPGTTYAVTVDFESINQDVAKHFKSLNYNVQTREFSFAVTKPVFELVADNVFNLNGEVTTSDEAEPAQIEKALQATQDGQPLSISWVHHTGANSSTYTVQKVVGKKDSKVDLQWNTQMMGINETGKYILPVYDPNQFNLMDVRHEGRPQSRIVSTYSDNLKATQNLEGLISIKNSTSSLRHVMDGNKIYTYVAGELEGDIIVSLSTGITSIKNIKLHGSSEWEINIPGSKPAVRFVGKGNIVPQSNEVILPFEAIGLKSIEVEVFKIYDNNILQFLQTNELNESYELYRVGKIISQTKIKLNDLSPGVDHTQWSHYAIDLSSLLKTDPNAIYQIRIGFTPSDTYLPCIEPEKNEPLVASSNEELISFFDENYYGTDGYYEGYDWNDREDPCKAAFYNADHFISKNIVVSNFGIIAKLADKQLFVAVTDLRTTDPINGAVLEVYDLQSQKIIQLTTNADGIAQQLVTSSPAAIVVSHQGQKGYLKLSEGLNLSMSAFDVDGEKVHKGLKGYIYGERGVWRPGDSLYLNFILNDREIRLPVGHPVSMQIFDARNKLVVQKINSQSVGGIYSFPIKTTPDANTGIWRAVVKAGGVEFTKSLKVEAIKPNRLKIIWDAPAELFASQSNINLSANWLTGLKAQGLTAKVSGKWSTAESSWPTFKEFSFTDPARSNIDQPEFTLYDGALDADGHANVPLTIAKDFKPAGIMNLRTNIEVSEPGGDFSMQSNSSVYHPYRHYVGVKLPSDPWGYRTLNINAPSSIQFASIDPKGKPQGNRKLTVGLYEMEWRWWWEHRENAYADYNSTTHTKAIRKSTITTNANGLAEWKADINHWGRYMIRVCDVESGHCSGDFAYAGWPEGGSDKNFDMATLLRLHTSKEKYNTTEMVELSIPAPVLSKMLITLENGSKVIESHWVTIDKSPYIFRFQATPQMAPAIYAHVQLIQPHGFIGNDLPMRMYGIHPIYIENEAARLLPKINASNTSFKPDRAEQIEISETNGRAMAYTLDIVDEGLLDLTSFKTPDAYGQFYAKEALGVRTWDVYDHVLGAFGGKLESILSIGGDESLNSGNSKNNVTRFKSPVIHLGPFQLKKGEKKKHTIRISNYAGSVRAMVVAAGDGAYGSVDKTFPVKSALMILPTLPRVLSTGEEVTLPVNIFVTESNIKQISVTVKDKNNLIQWESNTKNIQAQGSGDIMEYFTFKTSDKPGKSLITIEAKANGETAKNEIEIETRNPNPFSSIVSSILIEAGASKTIQLIGPTTAVDLKGQIEVSTFQPVRMSKYIDDLIQYPYGCAEQIASAAFPQLYLDKFIQLDAKRMQEVKNNIQGAISALNRFSQSDGSFALWPGAGQHTDPWVTSYIGHFMIEAQKKGYLVPDHLLLSWKNYQRRIANLYDLSQKPLYSANHGLDQAYRLYTLAIVGIPELGAMNRLKEYGQLGNNARWRLAAAYAVVGQKETAKSLMVKAPESTDYIESGYSYGSPLRDQAMVMETFLEVGEKSKAAEYAIDIAEQLNTNQQWNTQALAYALKVLGQFQGNAVADAKWNFKYQVGNDEKQNVTATAPSFLIDPKMGTSLTKTVTIENPSAAPIYVLTSIQGQPVQDLTGDESNNLKLDVRYNNALGQVIDPAALNKGDQISISITIKHTGIAFKSYQNLALNHILPAGWEIINERMLGEEVQSGRQYQYQDIRDDRVLTFFTLLPGTTKTFTTRARATYTGSYHLPAILCEEMYDLRVKARIKGGKVTVQ